MLAGHLDTVPAQGNGTARRVDDRLYGLGSTDMKSGDAVMLALLETLDPASLRFDLAAVFYDAEEGPPTATASGACSRRCRGCARPRLAILLEPTDLKVELGCNGVAERRGAGDGARAPTARGRGPASTRSSARRRGSREVTRFAATGAQRRRASSSPRRCRSRRCARAGRATSCPTSWSRTSTIASRPTARSSEAERALRALVPAEFEFTVVDRAPPGQVCADAPEVREFVERFGAAVAGKQGWTDVARFTAAGIPAFNFGPGVPELAHQASEYCPIDNLEPALPVARRVPRTMSRRSPPAATSAIDPAGPSPAAAQSAARRRAGEYPFVRLERRRAASWCRPESTSINFSIGDPRERTPDFIRETLRARGPRGLELSRRSPGMPELRAAVRRLARAPLRRARSIPSAELLPGQRHQGGGVPARRSRWSVARRRARHGRDPVAGLSGLRAGRALRRAPRSTWCRCASEDGWRFDPERVPDEVWERTALLWLNYPHNPTGAVLDRASAASASPTRARAHGFWVASDEAYAEIYFDAPPPLDARVRARERARVPHAEQALGDDRLPLGLHGRRSRG